MLVGKRPHLGRMVQYVGTPVLLLAAYESAIVFVYQVLHWTWVAAPNIPVALYGSAIGIIVGFRNNSAYSRWWEGRQLWGQIVNNSRSLARQVMATLRPRSAEDAAEVAELHAMQRRLLHHQIAYVHVLRQALRELPPWEELARVLPEADLEALRDEKNLPLTLQQQMGEMLRECQDRGWIDSIGWQAMDRNLDDLADAQGGCERIKNTPMPKQYEYFPQLFVQIYCLVLPVGMVQDLGWFTPLGSTVVGFIFLALDKIGRDLEDPFDNQIFDVPMTAITVTIEINLRQLLGERDVPERVRPVHEVLW